MEITIDGELSSDPRDRILAVEAITQSMCEHFGYDPAEGVMMLLTAAVRMASKQSGRPIRSLAPVLAVALDSSIEAAHAFFNLRIVTNDE